MIRNRFQWQPLFEDALQAAGTPFDLGEHVLPILLLFIGELHRPDVALLPIGDFYTMGPREAALAVRMLGVKHVIPMHYGTFPILTGRPEALSEALQSLGLHDVEVVAMKPGQTI